MEQKENELTPEDKMMRAIFGDKWKTKQQIKKEMEERVEKACEQDSNLNRDSLMLFVHALERNDELAAMVETISENKYFPNEHYRNVFRHSLMEAAQWQYEQLMERAVDAEVSLDYYDDKGRENVAILATNVIADEHNIKDGDKVKVIIIKD